MQRPIANRHAPSDAFRLVNGRNRAVASGTNLAFLTEASRRRSPKPRQVKVGATESPSGHASCILPGLPSPPPGCIMAAPVFWVTGTGHELSGRTGEIVIAPSQTNSNPATLVNALTVDVEDYFHVAALAPNISRDSWSTRESRVVGNTVKLLEMFDQFDVRGTFFVLGWVAERHPQLVKDIAARGHEIACHGYSHRLVYEQSHDEFYEETLRSKKLLEDITGSAVLGYRAASYSIVRESLWAMDMLAELGFTYDSSIFPVRHDRYGIPDAERAPHRMKTPNGSSIIEWPLATATILGYRLPVAGGGYFRLLPYWLSRWGLASINNSEQRPFIFYLHPWEIDPGQPRVAASRLSRFRHYTNLGKCEERLRRLLGEFKFGTARDGLAQLGLLPASAAAK